MSKPFMNTNKFSLIGIVKDSETKYNTRVKLNTGTICNYKCKFCYTKNKLHLKPNIEKIYQQIDKLYSFGFREMDMSGGEPSILPEFFDLLDYCKNKGIKVSTLTNGFKFANMEFCKKAQKHGLNEILFSLHGSNEELHDRIVGHKGAFEKILKAIKNAKELGMTVRINCTVFNENYKTLYNEYPKLINELNPFEVNFIELNYFNEAHDNEKQNLKELVDAIKFAIDNINCELINVRYVPFCYMQGYEKHCVNYFQHIYDPYDWNMLSYAKNIDEYKDKPLLDSAYKIAGEHRLADFYKDEKCRRCKYFYICDGMKNEIGEENDVFPIDGKKIHNVNHFRIDFFNKNC